MATTPYVSLPTAIGAGHVPDFNNYFAGVPRIAWVRWQDAINNCAYAYNYQNPAIKGYEIIIYNADGSIYLNVNDWKFHSMFCILYTDPRISDPLWNQGGDFLFVFGVNAGESYTAVLKVHGVDGSVLETAPMFFSVPADVPPLAISTAPATQLRSVKKK